MFTHRDALVRSLAIVAGLSLVALGCDDSTPADPDAGDSPVDAGGGGEDAGGGGEDAGGGGEDAGGGGEDAGAVTDAGRMPDAGRVPDGGGASAAADAFCMNYEDTCGFGGADRHADFDACTSAFDGYDTARRTCVTTHVGLAESDPTTHCPHATGQAPCD